MSTCPNPPWESLRDLSVIQIFRDLTHPDRRKCWQTWANVVGQPGILVAGYQLGLLLERAPIAGRIARFLFLTIPIPGNFAQKFALLLWSAIQIYIFAEYPLDLLETAAEETIAAGEVVLKKGAEEIAHAAKTHTILAPLTDDQWKCVFKEDEWFKLDPAHRREIATNLANGSNLLSILGHGFTAPQKLACDLAVANPKIHACPPGQVPYGLFNESCTTPCPPGTHGVGNWCAFNGGWRAITPAPLDIWSPARS